MVANLSIYFHSAMKSYEKVLLFMPNTPLQHIVAMEKKQGL